MHAYCFPHVSLALLRAPSSDREASGGASRTSLCAGSARATPRGSSMRVSSTGHVMHAYCFPHVSLALLRAPSSDREASGGASRTSLCAVPSPWGARFVSPDQSRLRVSYSGLHRRVPTLFPCRTRPQGRTRRRTSWGGQLPRLYLPSLASPIASATRGGTLQSSELPLCSSPGLCGRLSVTSGKYRGWFRCCRGLR